MVSGWTMFAQGGTVTLAHTSGFFVAGFESKIEAGVWLSAFILGQQRDLHRAQERAKRARLRILRALPAQGRVS
jgi:hypothetical protein